MKWRSLVIWVCLPLSKGFSALQRQPYTLRMWTLFYLAVFSVAPPLAQAGKIVEFHLHFQYIFHFWKEKNPSLLKKQVYFLCKKHFHWKCIMLHCPQWYTWKKVVPVQEAELVAEVAQLWPYQLGAWLTQTHQLSAAHLHQYQLVTCIVLTAKIIRTRHHNHSQMTADTVYCQNNF